MTLPARCSLFSEVEPAYFGTFLQAMFTFWMMLTFDNACGVTWSLIQIYYESPGRVFGVALFFVSFQLAVGYVMMNIVMAVLLDEFNFASDADKADAAERQEAAALLVRPLDALLNRLVRLEPEGVEDELQALCEAIDEDGSGSIEREELLNGMARLADLRRLDLMAILRGLLPWPLPSRLDQALPAHLTLPKGRAAVDYTQPVPIASARA